MYNVYLTKLKNYFIVLFELEDEEVSLSDFWEPALGLLAIFSSFFILRAIMFRG